MDASRRPKIAETVIHETPRLREADIGRRCEILRNTRFERLDDFRSESIEQFCRRYDPLVGANLSSA